jgi:hypothetical protein
MLLERGVCQMAFLLQKKRVRHTLSHVYAIRSDEGH